MAEYGICVNIKESLTNKDMASKYQIQTYKGTHNIRIRNTDGYVCLTDMAQATDTLIANYLRNESTKAFLEGLSAYMRISIINLVEQKSKKTGTWAHMRVAINFAQWCNPDFAVWAACVIEQIIEGKVKLEQWTIVRQDGKSARKEYTSFLKQHIGLVAGRDYATVTNMGYLGLFGMTACQIRQERELIAGSEKIARNHIPEALELEMIQFFEQMVPTEHAFNGGDFYAAVDMSVRKTKHKFAKALPPPP